uniref:Ubiquitin carboxyl-terminal hydrolase 15-like isoform X4 n=1 Tax=Rhizophora mucronata TaxID=61149 RepID=A0A2P2MY51_RHIMU
MPLKLDLETGIPFFFLVHIHRQCRHVLGETISSNFTLLRGVHLRLENILAVSSDKRCHQQSFNKTCTTSPKHILMVDQHVIYCLMPYFQNYCAERFRNQMPTETDFSNHISFVFPTRL